MNVSENILEVELEIRKLDPETRADSDSSFHPVRRSIAGALLAMLEGVNLKGRSLPDLIDAATHNMAAGRRAALLIVRAVGRPGVIPDNDSTNQWNRRLVDLARAALPDICKAYKIDEKAQTYVNAASLRSIHRDICARLEPLRSLPTSPQALVDTRQIILKLLGGQIVSAYLQPFEGKSRMGRISTIYAELETLLKTVDYTFSHRLQALRATVEDELAWISANRTFFSDDYYSALLGSVVAALDAVSTASSARFQCDIHSSAGTEAFVLEKRYPLRDSSRVHKVSIPLVNAGPGVAIGVRTNLATKNDVAFGAHDADLGDVPPGEFALTAELLVGAVLEDVTIHLEVNWGVAGAAERRIKAFVVKVRAQASDVDWAQLERREPYSTSPAEGAEFVGRRDRVQTLSNRLVKERMQSSYITGQKRVGKSSLALAVRDHVQALTGSDDEISFLYLEYGEIADVDPRLTMRNLGQRIAEFLLRRIPRDTAIPGEPDYAGSLAPLSRICEVLLREAPRCRYVVVLDEFDEIPPELYRSGALAETFFSNLRTLSAKKNLAFMLVGGENMPFIVAAQGDQLNKFVREGLTYFSRTDDWADFNELVTSAVRGHINWHGSAITELFTLSSGHPYYAKLLCAKVYATAVAERDAEVTSEEVRRAYRTLVTTLDTNSFAHLWKDGIAGTRDEAEVIALQRCRVLVALGRVLRAGKPVTEENVRSFKYSVRLAHHQIAPTMHDFCRRDILREERGEYSFTLPLFRDWLMQSGINALIDDSLGDELATSLQQAEDQAFVKEGEISRLTDEWPLYRSRSIAPGDVRQWLGQVTRFHDQRLLFKLLAHVRFFSEMEIREKLRIAHGLVLPSLPTFVRRTLSERRRDIVVTYVDGAAKSGHYYAARYAEENLLASDCVKEMNGFAEELARHEESANVTINGVVLVDDIIGTGNSLSDDIEAFVARNRPLLEVRNVSIVVVVICATPEGEARLRRAVSSMAPLRIDVRVCEPLGPKHCAFQDGSKVWATQEEASEARALCRELGSRISKSAPLGYGDQGLLVVFPNTCPNNSLPILHGSAGRDATWRPLFRRPVT